MTENSYATVLVVDDVPAWRSRVREMLQPHPEWKIIAEASDGEDAVHKATEYQADIILLDIGLPKLNGIEAARRIRQGSPHHAHIVFVTQEGDKDIRDAALSIQGTRYVMKSNVASQLLPAIAAALADHYAATL
jgi:DNA-binding NarL/FixJ family response regulator